MLRLVGALVLLLALVACFGYYRGWFHADERNTNDQRSIQLTVDKEKFDQDKVNAEQKVQDLGHR